MSLNILHLSTSDSGGAGIAALRLHEALLTTDIDSHFLCLNKSSQTKNIHVFPKFYPRFYHRILDKLGFPITQGQKNERRLQYIKKHIQPEMFSFLRSDYQLHHHPLVKQADVIILHWVAGFLDYSSFFKAIPKEKSIYWYTHDFSSIQGGFHTLFDKKRFAQSEIDKIENQLKKQKRKYIANCPKLKFIANSQFTYKTLLESKVTTEENINYIPLGIPLNELNIIDKSIAKQALGLDPNKIVIITVAAKLAAVHKAMDRFDKIRSKVTKKNKNILFVTLGASSADHHEKNSNLMHLGKVWNPQFKSIVFSAADLVVSTSYEETFGQTIIEGYACGTPAMVFNNAALPELVIPNRTGYIANSLENFIEHLLALTEDQAKLKEMSENAYILFKEKYTSQHQVDMLLELINT